MSVAIKWTPRAEEQFNKVLSDLYDVSPNLSEKWTDELDAKLNLLTSFPEMGRLVLTKDEYFYREILVGRYSVRYLYVLDFICIVSIKHQASNA